jgi:aspartate/methionine/tyrosine aminotransferase
MTTFSKSVEAMPRSGIREIMDLAWSLGDDVIRLMVGEPDFPTPQHIVKAAKTALDNGATRYIANAGLPELREVVAAHFEKQMGLPTKASNVLITHGAMASVATAVAVTCDPGDEILISDPAWPNYAMAAQMFQATPVYYPLRIENELAADCGFGSLCHRQDQVPDVVFAVESNWTGF